MDGTGYDVSYSIIWRDEWPRPSLHTLKLGDKKLVTFHRGPGGGSDQLLWGEDPSNGLHLSITDGDDVTKDGKRSKKNSSKRGEWGITHVTGQAVVGLKNEAGFFKLSETCDKIRVLIRAFDILGSDHSIGSVGLEYLPTSLPYKSIINVGK